MDDRLYRRTVELLEADISDEMVALEPNRGQCFGFNEVAKDVWRALETPRRFEDLKASLLDQYDVDEDQCASDLSELLDGMIEAKLVEACSGDRGEDGRTQ